MRDRIQNAGVLLSSSRSLLRACSVAEQPLESHARIDLCRKGLGGRRPRDAIRVGAAITKVATAEIAGVFNPELKRRQYCVLPPLLRDHLIDRDAQIRTHCVSPWPGPGEYARAACMVAGGFFQGGRGSRGIQSGDEDHVITEWLQWFRDERKFEVFTFLQRTPIARRGAMRMPYTHKAPDFVGTCCRLAQRCLSR